MQYGYGGDNDLRWWLARHGDELASAVFKCARKVDDATVDRQQRILEAYTHYGDTDGWPKGGMGWGRRSRMAHNILANAVDTLVSEVTQTQPRPMAVSNGGDWEMRVRSEALTNYWDAQFDRLGVRESAPQVARDAVIAGLGVWRPYVDWDYECLRLERVFPLMLLVDDVSCIDVEPRSVFLRRFVDKWQLIEQVRKDESISEERKEMLCVAIRKAGPPDHAYSAALPFDTVGRDVVEVIEGWHLPSVYCDHDIDDDADEYGEDAEDAPESHDMGEDGSPYRTDGRHVCVIKGETLFDEPYLRDRFPLPVMRPVPPVRGFWGESLVMRAAPAQIELNKLLERVQDAMHLISVPRWLVQNGSINNAKMVNNVGVQIEYTGNPPQLMTPNAMAGDVYQLIPMLADWIYQELGVSQMSANSLKPKGLDSGKAIDLYNDVQSKRFIGFERSYEHAHVWLAKELVVCERELAKDDGSEHEVWAAAGDERARIDFAEVEMDEDDYIVRVLPASAIVTTAAHALDTIEKMVQAGLLSPEMGFRAMYNPDPKAVLKELTAAEDALRDNFRDMLSNGEYMPPDVVDNVMLGIELAKTQILVAKRQGFPEEHVKLLRRWIVDAVKMQQRGAQQDAPPAPPALPPAPEMMPPGAMPPDGMPMEPPMMDAAMPPPTGPIPAEAVMPV